MIRGFVVEFYLIGGSPVILNEAKDLRPAMPGASLALNMTMLPDPNEPPATPAAGVPDNAAIPQRPQTKRSATLR